MRSFLPLYLLSGYYLYVWRLSIYLYDFLSTLLISLIDRSRSFTGVIKSVAGDGRLGGRQSSYSRNSGGSRFVAAKRTPAESKELPLVDTQACTRSKASCSSFLPRPVQMSRVRRVTPVLFACFCLFSFSFLSPHPPSNHFDATTQFHLVSESGWTTVPTQKAGAVI